MTLTLDNILTVNKKRLDDEREKTDTLHTRNNIAAFEHIVRELKLRIIRERETNDKEN